MKKLLWSALVLVMLPATALSSETGKCEETIDVPGMEGDLVIVFAGITEDEISSGTSRRICFYQERNGEKKLVRTMEIWTAGEPDLPTCAKTQGMSREQTRLKLQLFSAGFTGVLSDFTCELYVVGDMATTIHKTVLEYAQRKKPPTKERTSP